jgi:hypothetical protein
MVAPFLELSATLPVYGAPTRPVTHHMLTGANATCDRLHLARANDDDNVFASISLATHAMTLSYADIRAE